VQWHLFLVSYRTGSPQDESYVHNSSTQVTKSHVKSWITVLDTMQSTATAIKSKTVNIAGTSQYLHLTQPCNPHGPNNKHELRGLNGGKKIYVFTKHVSDSLLQYTNALVP